jgi:hypothetical protein
MEVFVLNVNGEVCGVFSSKEKIINFLEKDWYVESLVFEDDDDEKVKFSLKDGVDYLLNNFYKVRCLSEELIERGNDYCEIELSKMIVV